MRHQDDMIMNFFFQEKFGILKKLLLAGIKT